MAVAARMLSAYGGYSSFPNNGSTGYHLTGTLNGVPSGYSSSVPYLHSHTTSASCSSSPASAIADYSTIKETKTIHQTISVTPTPAFEYSTPMKPVESATKIPPNPGHGANYYPPKHAPYVHGAGSPSPPSEEEVAAHGYPPRPSPSPYGGSNRAQYHGPAFLPKGCHDLTPALGQEYTNGKSTWGTTKNPNLPDYLPGPKVHGGNPYGGKPPGGSESTPGGYPHGGSESTPGGYGSGNDGGAGSGNGSDNPSCSSCDIEMPNTGITRHYELTIEEMKIAPDGVERDGLVFNGQFPGPLIEANWGDWIEVTVNNKIDTEGTAIHWHGLLQRESQWMDGVPTVAQCPLVPDGTFTYRFRADRYGTSWYHSHYSAQYNGGAFGPMVIHGPKCDEDEYDIDIGPVMLSDWYHPSYFELVDATMNAPAPGRPPLSNNILINGKNNYPCANTTKACTPNAGLAKFKFESGKKHLLRLINPSADAMIKFSIDGHSLTVVANDFVPIKPYTTNVVTIGVGQRTDVIVEGLKNVTSVWMRADTGPPGPASCSINDGISPIAMAGVYFDGADENEEPTSASSVTEGQLLTCKNDDLSRTVPMCPMKPDMSGIFEQDLSVELKPNSTGHFNWLVNNQTFRGDYNDALLLEAKLGNLTWEPQWNVYNFKDSKTVRLVVYNHFPLSAHPMHLHGHDFWVLDEGFGTWNGSIVNANNPIRRDVHILQKAQDFDVPSYSVLQYNLDNPGVWPFHCHVAWHVSAGLYVNLLERPDDIEKIDIPSSVAQTCRDWSVWSGNNVVAQIDSGL